MPRTFSNAVPNPFTAALSGTPAPATAPALSLAPSSVTFAPQFAGTTSAPQTVTLTSSGTAPLVISSITSSGDFAFAGCGPSTIAPGGTCTFSITFRSFSAGPQSGSIVITSNAPGSPHTIALSGNGASLAAPAVSMEPGSFDFGSVRTGTSAVIRGRLTNSGATTLTLSGISASGASFSQSNDCPPSLPVAGSCEVVVTYAPGPIGPHSGQLVIHSNAIPSPRILAMSGTGVDVPPPVLEVAGAVSFGQQVTGTVGRRTLSLANTGGDRLVVSEMRILGAAVFAVESGCTTIEPGGTCVATLTFRPSALGSINARLDIVSNHAGGVVHVALTGEGIVEPRADLQLSVGAIGFGNQAITTTSEARTVRLTSVGTIALRIDSIAVAGDFLIAAGGCPASLAPDASCDVSVTFRPIAGGSRVGLLTVESAAATGTKTVSLSGVGCRFFSIAGRNPERLCSP